MTEPAALRWDEGPEGLEAAVRALLAEGWERARVESPRPLDWRPSRGLERVLLEGAQRLELSAGGEKPYASFPSPEARRAFPLEERRPSVRLRVRLSRTAEAAGGHVEQTRLLRRALRRSGLPLAQSQSRRPDLKLGFGPAAPAGQESRAEYVDVELWKRVPDAEARRSLEAALPPGFALLELRRVPLHYPSVESLTAFVEYELRGASAAAPLPDGVLEAERKGEVLRVLARRGLDPKAAAEGGGPPLRVGLWFITPEGERISP